MLSQLIERSTQYVREASLEEQNRIMPLIDFGPYVNQEPGAHERIIQQLRAACESTGFFQIVNSPISPDVVKNAFRASKQFFELPFDEKLTLSKDMFSNRGYELMEDFVLEGEEDSSSPLEISGIDFEAGSYPGEAPLPPSSIGYVLPPSSLANGEGSSMFDADMTTSNAVAHGDESISNEFRESFYFGNDNLSKDRLLRPFQGPNKWPSTAGSSFRKALVKYHDQMLAFANHVMSLLAESLELSPDAFDEFCSDPTTSIRLLRYPSSPSRLGVQEHTDADALTLMSQDNVKGLEILDPVSNCFLSVSPAPGALIANLGDIMAILTNNRYKSSMHRVCNNSGSDRYTIPFFLQGNIDYVVAPLPGLGPSTAEPIAVEDLLRDHFQNSYTSHTTSLEVA